MRHIALYALNASQFIVIVVVSRSLAFPSPSLCFFALPSCHCYRHSLFFFVAWLFARTFSLMHDSRINRSTSTARVRGQEGSRGTRRKYIIPGKSRNGSCKYIYARKDTDKSSQSRDSLNSTRLATKLAREPRYTVRLYILAEFMAEIGVKVGFEGWSRENGAPTTFRSVTTKARKNKHHYAEIPPSPVPRE